LDASPKINNQPTPNKQHNTMSDTTENKPENIIPINVETIEAPLESSPEEETKQDASDASETPAAGQTEKPQTVSELVAAIDITGVTHHEIIVDLIAGIQQLALRATIALGLLERIKVAEEATASNDAETTAE
jgi:hypothetical protein